MLNATNQEIKKKRAEFALMDAGIHQELFEQYAELSSANPDEVDVFVNERIDTHRIHLFKELFCRYAPKNTDINVDATYKQIIGENKEVDGWFPGASTVQTWYKKTVSGNRTLTYEGETITPRQQLISWMLILNSGENALFSCANAADAYLKKRQQEELYIFDPFEACARFAFNNGRANEKKECYKLFRETYKKVISTYSQIVSNNNVGTGAGTRSSKEQFDTIQLFSSDDPAIYTFEKFIKENEHEFKRAHVTRYRLMKAIMSGVSLKEMSSVVAHDVDDHPSKNADEFIDNAGRFFFLFSDRKKDRSESMVKALSQYCKDFFEKMNIEWDKIIWIQGKSGERVDNPKKQKVEFAYRQMRAFDGLVGDPQTINNYIAQFQYQALMQNFVDLFATHYRSVLKKKKYITIDGYTAACAFNGYIDNFDERIKGDSVDDESSDNGMQKGQHDESEREYDCDEEDAWDERAPSASVHRELFILWIIFQLRTAAVYEVFAGCPKNEENKEFWLANRLTYYVGRMLQRSGFAQLHEKYSGADALLLVAICSRSRLVAEGKELPKDYAFRAFLIGDELIPKKTYEDLVEKEDSFAPEF